MASTNVLRTCGRDDQQAEVAANYVLKNFKDKRVAIINDKGAYGKGLADAFKATLNAGGIKEVIDDSAHARRQGLQRADHPPEGREASTSSISAVTTRKAACWPASCMTSRSTP